MKEAGCLPNLQTKWKFSLDSKGKTNYYADSGNKVVLFQKDSRLSIMLH